MEIFFISFFFVYYIFILENLGKPKSGSILQNLGNLNQLQRNFILFESLLLAMNRWLNRWEHYNCTSPLSNGTTQFKHIIAGNSKNQQVWLALKQQCKTSWLKTSKSAYGGEAITHGFIWILFSDVDLHFIFHYNVNQKRHKYLIAFTVQIYSSKILIFRVRGKRNFHQRCITSTAKIFRNVSEDVGLLKNRSSSYLHFNYSLSINYRLLWGQMRVSVILYCTESYRERQNG